jgi:hypothetical protein
MRAVLKAQINKTDRNDARHSADDAGGALSPGLAWTSRHFDGKAAN